MLISTSNSERRLSASVLAARTSLQGDTCCGKSNVFLWTGVQKAGPNKETEEGQGHVWGRLLTDLWVLIGKTMLEIKKQKDAFLDSNVWIKHGGWSSAAVRLQLTARSTYHSHLYISMLDISTEPQWRLRFCFRVHAEQRQTPNNQIFEVKVRFYFLFHL